VFLYGYDDESHDGDGSSSVESIAISLISGLRGIGRSSLSAKPVVFLAHSLGGVVLKQCLIELANAGQSEMFMVQRIKACVFLAVPNRLPGPGVLAAMVSSKRFGGLLKELQAARNVGYLSSMSGILAGIAKANHIRLCSGYETVGSILGKPPQDETLGGTTRSALLVQKEESIRDGSRNSDQFPILMVRRARKRSVKPPWAHSTGFGLMTLPRGLPIHARYSGSEGSQARENRHSCGISGATTSCPDSSVTRYGTDR
jgi:hypothetical protein